ncbi:Do family serine endopeptidase [Hippea maritima]|uniref:Protease Do n=1 Tax=Hippea maritima (strain ATCC 700847 / DSM 10411 / MH2) TaxID=760142 RepID=F2LUT3_HIPMA|nr:Do family serine endopeptidase [Hippea maritima]AEA33538.1 protease Do [Hippea maritima DSM 10411]
MKLLRRLYVLSLVFVFVLNAVVFATCLPDIRSVAKKALPAVVNISTTQIVEAPSNPFGFGFDSNDPFNEFFKQFFNNIPVKRKIHALGSGFIISKNGYILTNYHVVRRASTIRVTLLKDKAVYKAKVVGEDPKADIALIKIKPREDLPVLKLGDSSKLEIGDWVVAVGNPFGLNGTVTAGIISAKGRVIGEGPYDHFLQTDAAINPGNSGGPLLNLNGEVVGINTAIVAGGQGIGFAIPINMVKSELPYLMKGEKVKRGYLGVTVQDLTSDAAKALQLKNIEGGAIISQVFKNSPAAKAGLKPGDIIVTINGQPVLSAGDLSYKVFTMKPGVVVDFGIIRNGNNMDIKVKLGRRPTSEEMAENITSIYKTPYGFSVSNITPQLKNKYDIKVEKGVVVVKVEPGSFAYSVGIQPGDVIVKMNYKRVKNIHDLKKIISKSKDKNVVFFNIIRGTTQIFVTIQR